MSTPAETSAVPSAPGPEAGPRIVRGGALRAAAHVLGTIATAAAFVLLLRYLGVDDFGRFSTVVALMTIATGLADAGLTATGLRRFAVVDGVPARQHLLRALVGLRLAVMPVAIGVTVAFALLAGYDREMVIGVLVTGLGGMLVVTATTVAVPLAVELRYVALAALELGRQLTIALAIAAFVIAGASLGALFWSYALGGVAMLVIGWALVGSRYRVLPAYDGGRWGAILRESMPLAVALAINSLYLKILIVLASLLVSEREVGLFAAASRITEVLIGLPSVMVGIAFPLLSHAGEHDEPRLTYALQRLAEAALLVGGLLAVVLFAAAEPIIAVLGGPEFAAAADVLRIQAFALLGASLTQVWVLGVMAIQERRALLVVNVISLIIAAALGVALIPAFGAIGASAAAVAGETIMAFTMVTILVRARPALRPQATGLVRYVLVLVAALAVCLLPIPPVVAAVISGAVFAGLAWLTGIVPVEIAQALNPRRRGAAQAP